jgi:hypothetical protein
MVSRIEFPPTERESLAALEERVRVLEDRVATLTEAMRVLAHGLEDLPVAEPASDRAAVAARSAHDLLLMSMPGPRAD